MPGVEEKELGIEVSDNRLTVKGERTEAKEQKDRAFRLRERLERAFERRFELPTEANTEHVRAKFPQGVRGARTPDAIV